MLYNREEREIVIKIDMEKAYDRMSWNFIKDTLHAVAITNTLIEAIMLIISTGRCCLLWNGEATDFINPKGGHRKGDPL